MYTKIQNLNINYKESGNGPETVVILQGWGTSCEVYNPVAAVLEKKYRVVWLDFPGFGKSEEPPCGWSVDDYADFTEEFMQRLGIRRAILLGHSYGGRVIIKLSNRKNRSFEISRIILVDSAGVLPKKTFRKKLKIARYKLLKKIAGLPFVYALFQEMIDEWKNSQGSEDYRNASPVMKQCLVKAVNEDLTGLLSGVSAETLLIWGDADTATPLSDGQLMEKRMPNAGLAVIRGAGHFSFLDQPAVFERIISSYLGIGVHDGNN